MSLKIMDMVLEYPMPDLYTDKGEKVSDVACNVVLLMYANSANDYGHGAYPGIRRVMKQTKLSKQWVCNAINALRHNGYLTYKGKSELDTNDYKINLSKLRVYPVDPSESSGWTPPGLPTRPNPTRGGVNLFELWEKEIGPLTPMIADTLTDMEKSYPNKWIVDAISEAVKHGKRNLAYVNAILKRWKEQGNQDEKKPSKAAAEPPRRRMPRIGADGRVVHA